MHEIIAFFKDIFTLKESNDRCIGLCEFETPDKRRLVLKSSKNVKISDLMKRGVR